MTKQLLKPIWVALHMAKKYLLSGKYFLRVFIVAGIFALPAVFPDLEAAYQESSLASMQTVMEFVDNSDAVQFGYVDQAGIMAALGDKYADTALAFADLPAAEKALEAKEINRFYIIPDDFLETGNVTIVQRDDKLPTGNAMRDSEPIRVARAIALGVEDPDLALRIIDPGEVDVQNVGSKLVAWYENLDMGKLASAGIVTLFFYLVLSSSGFMMVYALDEEADYRILEVLRTSTTPAQFIGGKLLGIMLVLCVEVGLTFSVMVWAYQREGALLDVDLPLLELVIAGLYFLAGYTAFSSMTLGFMSWVASGMLERYELQAIIRDVGLLPLVGIVFVIVDPHSAASKMVSLFPVTSPLVMPFRMFYTDVSLTQSGLGLLLAGLWAAAAVWAAARIFEARYAL